MSKKRNITEEDIFIKARILSEGIRVDDNDLAAVAAPGTLYGLRPFVFGEAGIPVAILPNEYSRLKISLEGEQATVYDMEEVLATGHLLEVPSWLNESLSNGQPVMSVLTNVSSFVINIQLHSVCYNWDTGKECRYCGLFADPVGEISGDALVELAKNRAEAVKIATDHGWRGTFVIGGGALPPARRDEIPALLEMFLAPMRESLGEELSSEIPRVLNHYPPRDLSEMYKWKEVGISGTSFDIELMDPAYFAAICPGKHAHAPHEYWLEAQNASVEIFDRTTTGVVIGIEPMKMLVKGVEERLSKGVFPLTFNFLAAPGSAYENFRPPKADWIVEAAQRMAESFLRHSEKLLMEELYDASHSVTGGQPPFWPINVTCDEVVRRLEEQGD